jgi:trimeric autotransporter adhesin
MLSDVGNRAGRNLTTGNDNIEIGNLGVAGEADTIRIGTVGTQNGTFIAGISGVAVIATQVVVNSAGQLGVAVSSARFKEAIKPMDKASEAILALTPVTFRYKEEIDANRVPQFGLVAEQVEKVNPDLVVRDADGKVNTVRYDAVNTMLLNEFLKEHQKVQSLEAKLAQQQTQIDALTATVQKVSDQIALSKRAPQLVANP